MILNNRGEWSILLRMNKVILYYKFVPVADPAITMRWQKELCSRLGLTGRIIISKHGINGTLGGNIENLREYKREMNRSIIFKDIMYKWSGGTGHDFPRLSVKVRDELVAFGAPEEIKVDEKGVIGGGKHLKPEAVHKLIEERQDVIFFDGRRIRGGGRKVQRRCRARNQDDTRLSGRP